MQQIIFDDPYHFFSAKRSRIWPRIFRKYLPYHLDKNFGITSYEIRGGEFVQESMAKDSGIMLVGNHCRPQDPLVIGLLYRDMVPKPPAFMAGHHLFRESRIQCWMLRRVGAFSINRETIDRPSMNAAIETIASAARPLVIFPEGALSRCNDVLLPFMDGASLIARTAAKRRGKADSQSKVVLHPVAVKYHYMGDLNATVRPVLDQMEKRLTWTTRDDWPILDRIHRLGEAMLSIKEIEYLGQSQTGSLDKRIARLIEKLVQPLEQEWFNETSQLHTFARLQRLRLSMLPDMMNDKVTPTERAHRWRQLETLYDVQQFIYYPPGYLGDNPSPNRILETVERMEEDMTDVATIHRPMHVVIRFGPAIEVSPHRDRSAKVDPLSSLMRERLESMLAELEREGPEQLSVSHSRT